MKNKMNIKEIIKHNKLINEKKFRKERADIKRAGASLEQVKYNIIPPFTTERRIKTSI
jgi:hypothetical protein